MPRGGKRAGAGRPATGRPRWATRSVVLSEQHAKMLSELAHYLACSESEAARRAIAAAYLARAEADERD